jgi:hypothetical protein
VGESVRRRTGSMYRPATRKPEGRTHWSIVGAVSRGSSQELVQERAARAPVADDDDRVSRRRRIAEPRPVDRLFAPLPERRPRAHPQHRQQARQGSRADPVAAQEPEDPVDRGAREVMGRHAACRRASSGALGIVRSFVFGVDSHAATIIHLPARNSPPFLTIIAVCFNAALSQADFHDRRRIAMGRDQHWNGQLTSRRSL